MASVLIGVILPTPASQILAGQLGLCFSHEFWVERSQRSVQKVGMPLVPYDLALVGPNGAGFPGTKGFPHFVVRSTFTVLAGMRQPLARFSCTRSGMAVTPGSRHGFRRQAYGQQLSFRSGTYPAHRRCGHPLSLCRRA